MNYHIAILTGLLASTLFVCRETTVADAETPLNVMFIVVDDLRAELDSYGCDQIKSPNFDRLASSSSMQFNRVYVQQAICCVSRASFLTGCRPDSTGVDHPYTPWFNSVFRKKYQPVAKYFADLGYYSRTLGKVHHGPRDPTLTEPHFAEKAPDYHLPENSHGAQDWGEVYERLLPWEHAVLPDNAFRDGQIADETVATIRRAHKSGKPFFIASGFQKPHLPFVCPKKYYDLYSNQDVQRSSNPAPSRGQPLFTLPPFSIHPQVRIASCNTPDDKEFGPKFLSVEC